MSFFNGFEKRAVSSGWAFKKGLGGLATRAGHAPGSNMHTKAIGHASKIIKEKPKETAVSLKSSGLGDQIKAWSKGSTFDRTGAEKALHEITGVKNK